MEYSKVEAYITNWLSDYLESSSLKGFVVGVSGGVDSAVTSTLCAKTRKQTLENQHAYTSECPNNLIEVMNT